MHIPDGFLSAPVAITTSILSAGGVGYSLYRAGKTLPKSRTAMLGLSAAFIFAAQMVNFPVINGTSGHLVGAVLAAALVGPSAAVVAMSAVVILQCFAFADGGLTALGANLFNMAILGVASGYGVYRLLCSVLPTHYRPIAAGIAGWVSTMLAAAACAGQVALSGRVEGRLIFPAMLGVHALIGIGEGLITAMVLAAVQKTHAHLLDDPASARSSRIGPILAYGLLISLGIALFISPFACPWPDGLDHAAATLGFKSAEVRPLVPGLMPDYKLRFIPFDTVSTAVAGLIGTLAVFALGFAIARTLSATQPQTAEPTTTNPRAPRIRP